VFFIPFGKIFGVFINLWLFFMHWIYLFLALMAWLFLENAKIWCIFKLKLTKSELVHNCSDSISQI